MFGVAAYTNVGTAKTSNQDSCCVEVARTPYGDAAVIAVCDGVGGLASGEVASSSVVRWLVSWFERRFSKLLESLHGNTTALLDRVQADWDADLKTLNSTLLLHGRRTNQRMGSTFTAMVLYNNEYLIGHVGDCRVYKTADGELNQLTEDQTWVQREVARGTITAEQARSHPRRNIILQSVGTQEEIQAVFTRGTYKTNDVYMVCCDGFRNELFDDELLSSFDGLAGKDEPALYSAMESLADLAMRRGERDNITAVTLTCCADGEYGEPVVQYTTGIATLVEPDEDALPTGYLGSSDEVREARKTPAQSQPQATTQNPFAIGSENGEDDTPVVEPSGPLNVESVVCGQYKVVARAGEGDEPARSWIARDVRSDALVLLEETRVGGTDEERKTQVEHVVRDVNLAKIIDCPAMQQALRVAGTDDMVIVVKPYIETASIEQLIADAPNGLPTKDVLAWGIQLVELLCSLHALRPVVTCCDLRPANLVLGEDGLVRVVNLESLRFYRENEGINTDPVVVRGYTAPEAMLNGTGIDPRADIYQLGATLFHLTTGESPTKYANRLKLPNVTSVNPNTLASLAQIITRATSFDPDDRYQTAADMLAALQAVDLTETEEAGE